MACNNYNESWNWQEEDYYLEKDPSFGCLLNEVTTNQEDLSYMFEETTPVKACGDIAYQVNQGDNSKEPKEYGEASSKVKRRRMLQFDNQPTDFSLRCEEMSTAFLKSNGRDDPVEGDLLDMSQLVSGISEDASASNCDGMDQSSEGLLAEYFNDMEMHFSPDDINLAGASDVQIDISEFCNELPEHEANMVQKCIPRPRKNVVFKGRKSYIQAPPKLASSIAYPFAFIKPSGAHGDVTLKDINRRILTPPASKSNQSNEDSSASYPTSAFSGKPVVGKTKIRTEGGKGSITIMRTKG